MDLFGKKSSQENILLKEQIDVLTRENNELKAMLTPEMRDLQTIKHQIQKLTQERAQVEDFLISKQNECSALDKTIQDKRKDLIITEDEILYQSFGIYHPSYDFANSEGYKERLDEIRKSQKQCVKNNAAATGNMGWSVNGDIKKGNKMVRDMQKLLIRAFNSECDELVEKVKYNSFDSAKKRMISSANAISKLGDIMGISLTPEYLNLKLQELTLALEYRQKKQEEKEALKEAREKMREEAKVQKEIEEKRKKLNKESQHYENALADIEKQLLDTQSSDLLEKKNEILSKIAEIQKAQEDLNYREANQRVGYVYIISNIGAFGENVFKIGMTRREDPYERISELGDASVPFNFDVHAMIFSDDAPALETALHKAFSDRKVNMVNQRREFFNVSLEEIKKVVTENFDKTVEFIDIPEAQQYRISQKMRNGEIPYNK